MRFQRFGNPAAPLTFAFMALSVLLYLITATRSNSFSSPDSQILLQMGGSSGALLWEGEWQRLILPTFLHGGLLHILLNMMALQSLGPGAEIYFGSANFGTLYLLSGAGGFCFSQIFHGGLSIGASCSLFGLIGAMLAIEILRAPVLKYAWRSKTVQRQFMYAVVNLVLISLVPNIDNWGHLGGFLTGIFLGGLFEIWRRRRHLPHLGVAGACLCVAGVLCAARWPVYNPDYHIHMALVAKDNPDEAQHEYQQAREWSKFWGDKDVRVTEILITWAKDGDLSLPKVYFAGYPVIRKKLSHLLGSSPIPDDEDTRP